MVADERQPTAPHDFVDAPLRVAAVTDDIAEAKRVIDRRAIVETVRSHLLLNSDRFDPLIQRLDKRP